MSGKRWDDEREERRQDRAREDEAGRRDAETERRTDELREAWRRRHPQEERDERKRRKP